MEPQDFQHPKMAVNALVTKGCCCCPLDVHWISTRPLWKPQDPCSMRPTDKPLPLAKERRNGGRLGFHRLLRQGIQDCHFLGQRFVPGFKGLRVFRIPQAGSRCRWTSQQLLLRDLRWFRGPDACRSCRPGKQPSTGWCGFVWTCHRGPSISKRWSSWQPLPWPRSWWSAVRGICSGATCTSLALGRSSTLEMITPPKMIKTDSF